MANLSNSNDDHVEDHCMILHSTEKAFYVDFGSFSDWLPKSQTIVEDNGYPGEVKITMPFWLAKKKGLL